MLVEERLEEAFDAWDGIVENFVDCVEEIAPSLPNGEVKEKDGCDSPRTEVRGDEEQGFDGTDIELRKEESVGNGLTGLANYFAELVDMVYAVNVVRVIRPAERAAVNEGGYEVMNSFGES